MQEWSSWWSERWQRLKDWREVLDLGASGLWVGSAFALYLLVSIGLGIYWSQEPDLFVVQPLTVGHGSTAAVVPGYTLAVTTSKVASTLLDKPGGYLSNDILPPGVWLDDMPAWEQGVLGQVRDMVHLLHHDLSISHAQYLPDADLEIAESEFGFDAHRWFSTEGEYRRGVEALNAYSVRLAANDGVSAQFYPRAEYLRHWLADMDVRLGSLSTRLNAALPESAVMTRDDQRRVLPAVPQTSWSQIDDVFYEARGSSWALIHLLKAVEIDFADELHRHNAQLSLRAAIHELEATQQTVWSPMILNGSGFGLFANHSLVMANYINRAHLDLQDVRLLLAE